MKRRRTLSICNPPDTTSSFLYVCKEGKRNMWIYYECQSQFLFLLDPVSPIIESICFIDRLNVPNKYIVLTSCQREKKINVLLWQKIFPNIQIIVPDQSFLSNEKIIPTDTSTTIKNCNSVHFLNMIIGNRHRLCMKSGCYLFMGEIIYALFKGKNTLDELFHQNDASTEFFYTLETNNTVTFHSFGSIALFNNLMIHQHNLKDKFIDSWE